VVVSVRTRDFWILLHLLAQVLDLLDEGLAEVVRLTRGESKEGRNAAISPTLF
jgi:hypothetical protein